jgi:hypothetical protein
MRQREAALENRGELPDRYVQGFPRRVTPALYRKQFVAGRC